MAEVKKLRFLTVRGYGGMRFAAGAEADIPEPWASHFVKNGYAELADKPKAEAKEAAAPAAKKPAAKRKKNG